MQLFLTAFESIPDPRAENVRHDLVEILLIAFLSVLCGAQHCSEMAEFGRAKLKFLKRFLRIPTMATPSLGCMATPHSGVATAGVGARGTIGEVGHLSVERLGQGRRRPSP